MAWIDAEPDADVEATALVPADVEEVFDFLDDLGNHWMVADRFVEVVDLHRPAGDRAEGGRVRLRGPLGVRRTVTTRVVAAKAPRLLIGTAEIGERTRARVSWALAGHRGSTRVRLAAGIERASRLDRALLALGGRRWLRRRFESTLDGLVAEFEGRGESSAAGPLVGDPVRQA
ncbi:MAG TPA: SRPBCC family protein [Thermoleophilaceae bacterium]